MSCSRPARRAAWIGLTLLLVTLATGTNGGAATGGRAAPERAAATGWSGTVTASYSASGKSGLAQSTQQLEMQVTLKNDLQVSGTTTIHYLYTWANSCGQNTIKGDGSSAEPAQPSIYAPTPTTYSIAIGLGLYGAAESDSEYDIFNKCAKTDTTSKGGFSLGVPIVGGSADLTTATSISGTQTLTRGAGCAVGLPEYGHAGYDACTLTITWNLTKPTCDPDLLEKANREYEVAQQFNEAGLKELEKAVEVVQETVGTYDKDWVVENGLVTVLKVEAERAAKAVGKKAGELIIEDAEMYGLIYELYKLDQTVTGELIPAAVEVSALHKAAAKDFQSAVDEAKLAKADLDKALAQGPCVGSVRDKLNKLLKQDADDQKVRDKVESWRAPGSRDLYFVNNELVSEGAAIKHAHALLAAGNMLMSVGASPRKHSKRQIDAALASTRRAVALHAKTAPKLKAVRNRDKTLQGQLAALIRPPV